METKQYYVGYSWNKREHVSWKTRTKTSPEDSREKQAGTWTAQEALLYARCALERTAGGAVVESGRGFHARVKLGILGKPLLESRSGKLKAYLKGKF